MEDCAITAKGRCEVDFLGKTRRLGGWHDRGRDSVDGELELLMKRRGCVWLEDYRDVGVGIMNVSGSQNQSDVLQMKK